MGIFDIFKKDNKPLVKTEINGLLELKEWLSNQKLEISTQKKDFLKQFNDSLSLFINQLKDKNEMLKEINIDKIKASDREKAIVKENLTNYINHIGRFINSLNLIPRDDPIGIISKINEDFDNFSRRSIISFEKATYLVGDPLVEIKAFIKSFIWDIKSLLDKYKDFIDKYRVISYLDIKLIQLDEINKSESDAQKEKNDLEIKLSEIQKDINNIETKMSNLVSSSRYKERIENMNKLKKDEEKLYNEIGKLKAMIDFKELGKIYHTNDKKMQLINKYKANFYTAFQSESGLEIIKLLNESNLANEALINKANEIEKIKKEIGSFILGEDETKMFQYNISKLKQDYLVVTEKINREVKKFQKFDLSKKEISSSLKEALNKLGLFFKVD